jgi:hypothetical protein
MTGHDRWQPDIGILGTGRMGTRLAMTFARAGRNVMLGSRDPDRAAAVVAELGLPTLRAGRNGDALDAPAVLPTISVRDGLADVLNCHCRSLAGKLLIDISNPFNADDSDFVTPWDTRSCSTNSRRRASSGPSRTCSGKFSTIRNSAIRSATS